MQPLTSIVEPSTEPFWLPRIQVKDENDTKLNQYLTFEFRRFGCCNAEERRGSVRQSQVWSVSYGFGKIGVGTR